MARIDFPQYNLYYDDEKNCLYKSDNTVYVSTRDCQFEEPPVLNGYRFIIYEDKNNPSNNKYQDKLYQCNVDAKGEVLTWFAPNTFGFGKYIYTTGTKLIIKYKGNNSWRKDKYYIATFDGYNFVADNNSELPIEARKFRKSTGGAGAYTILEIVEPHYYRPEGRNVTAWDKFKSGGGDAPVDTFHGTLWYIVIMVVGTIFKARIGIWIVSTIIYFLWKYGYLNKK